MMKKANEFILLYHTAAKDDITKRPKAAKMFCGGKMALHFQQKREHLQAILPRDVHFDERTLTFLHRIDNIDLRNSASGRTARVRIISDANAEVHTGGPKMTNAEKLTLAKHACHIRMGVIEGTHSAKCGHPGGSLDIAEVLAYLYFVEMKVDPKDPKNHDRDRLVLSKGHAAPALYAALAERGFFPVEDLKTLRKIGSYLQGHPNMNSVPGVDMSTGSLGQGVSAACGMALGAKHAGKPINVYTILGDGEVEEGECWEAFMFASHYGLSNLCVMLDRNHLQIDGTTETVMNSAPLEEKLKAFNFNVLTINGHDLDAIESAITAFHAENEKPTCIILDTLKGKGVSFMENSVDWHGKGPNDEEYAQAMQELNAAYAALEEEDK